MACASWFVILLVLHILALLYLLYKLIVLAFADADLTLYSKKIKRSYFDKKVVWVTGASSGSKLILIYMLANSYFRVCVYLYTIRLAIQIMDVAL